MNRSISLTRLLSRTFGIAAAASAFVVLTASSSYAARGYQSRACGLDMNHNGIIGEPADCKVCDGSTADPDGDGTNERMIYVSCGAPYTAGTDNASCGAPGSPCLTVNYALNTRAQNGVQNIICFRGTCSNEPNNMPLGPARVSQHPLSTSYTVAASGSQVRSFSYPKDPTMIVGWDSDGDHDYPPHDTDDVAVLDGTGKDYAFTGDLGAPSYLELAHFSAKEYGRNGGSLGANAGTCGFNGNPRGFFGFNTAAVGIPSPNVYIHDLELVNINRGESTTGSTIAFPVFNGYQQSYAVQNVKCQDCGGIFYRGEPVDPTLGKEAGPFRVQNITWIANGARAGCQQGGAELAKVWGTTSQFEWLDSVADMNVANWTPSDFHYTHGLALAECIQNVDIINNIFIDTYTAGVNLKAKNVNTAGVCNTRPVDNVRIVRNEFRATHPSPPGFCCSTFILLEAVDNGANSNEYINNVTIADNFFSSTLTGNSGYEAAIYSTAARNGAQIPGTIRIIGNTIHGTYQGNYYPRASIGINNEFALQFPQQNYVIENNIFSGLQTNSSRTETRAVNLYYAPSNLQSDYNVFDPDSTLVWNGTSDMSLGAWQTARRGDTHSPACNPTFSNAASGDLHLTSTDSCARAKGLDLSSITTVDIDGTSRPAGPWDVGADQIGGSLRPNPPTLLSLSPVAQ